MLTKPLISFAVICMAISITVNAQVTSSAQTQNAADNAQNISAEKQALIQELLKVMDSKKSAEAVLDAMLDQMEKTLPEMMWETLSATKGVEELSAPERDRLHAQITENAIKGSQRIRELFTQRYNFAEMADHLTASLFAKYYDENQLRDLVTFYKSDTGRHVLEIMPNLAAESMIKAQEFMGPVIKDLINEISTEQSTKIEKEIAALIESHHKSTTGRGKSKRPVKRQ